MKKMFQWYLHAPLIWLNIGTYVIGKRMGMIEPEAEADNR